MSLATIAKKYNLSLSSLKRHRLNHMPRFLRLAGKVRELEGDDGQMVRYIVAMVDGKRLRIELDPYLKYVAKHYNICSTPEELKDGRAHSKKVKERDPDYWLELVCMVEDATPGFRVVK
ncbi:hypothetical protein ES707_21034 [subsurface metagenome]